MKPEPCTGNNDEDWKQISLIQNAYKESERHRMEAMAGEHHLAGSHRDFIVKVARRICRDAPIVVHPEDLAHDTWERIQTSIRDEKIASTASNGKNSATFHTLISRFALNHFITLLRHQKRERANLQVDGSPPFQVPDLLLISLRDGGDELDSPDMQMQVEEVYAQCVEPMGAKYAEVFILMALGYEPIEIAAEIGITAEAARSRIFKLLRRLESFCGG